MKRIFLFTLFFTTFITLIGCSSENVSELIQNEYERISALIPSEYNADLVLPSASEGFIVDYRVNNEVIMNQELIYDGEDQNKEILIIFEITYQDTTKGYGVLVVKQAEIIDELSDFQKVYNHIRFTLPEYMNSNLTLPESPIEAISIDYSIDCTSIFRNRLIYTFPNEEEVCTLLFTLDDSTSTQTFNIPIVMNKVDDLPKIPEIYIETNGSSIDSNEIYTSATLTMVKNQVLPFPELEDVPLQIRLRGNSTLYMPKLSYRIKFDEKTRFLSYHSERDWVLLANFTDQTLVRNFVAFRMANNLDMDFVPMYQFVDVYINGEYNGNYMLSDNIEVSNDRVDVDEHSTATDTGFLVEYDYGLYRVGLEESGENYFLIDGIPFIVKSPREDAENYREAQYIFINDYFDNLITVLKNKQDYSSYIDERSFIDWFIVNEVFKNVDSGYSSVYFYKDAGEKLKMGPVWDFDLSTGNQGHLVDELRIPEGWYTSREDKNLLFYHLMQYDSFQEALKERWNEMFDEVIMATLDDVLYGSDMITHSRVRNFERWDVIGKNEDWYTSPEVLAIESYDGQVWFLYDYLHTRILWLDEEINKF